MKVYTILFSLATVFAAESISAKDTATHMSTNSEIQWMTDFDAAKTLAKKESKPMFVVFTGSDWCPWCKKMENQIFATSTFKNALNGKVIFVKLDYPRNIAQDPATKKQNKQLAKQYSVNGFPVSLLLSSDGKEIERFSGFQSGGPEHFANKILEAIK